jgi:hypothetical protein
MIYSFLGIGDTIADDAKWLKMDFYNQETKQVEARGDVAITIELCSEQDATDHAVGYGRGSPNENPYLPYPPGRLDFLSLLNPITLIYEFFGVTGKPSLVFLNLHLAHNLTCSCSLDGRAGGVLLHHLYCYRCRCRHSTLWSCEHDSALYHDTRLGGGAEETSRGV